jgi:hypothetical protein
MSEAGGCDCGCDSESGDWEECGGEGEQERRQTSVFRFRLTRPAKYCSRCSQRLASNCSRVKVGDHIAAGPTGEGAKTAKP